MWKPIFAFSFCISFGFTVSDWWVALSGVSVRGLNQHFLALSWKWLYSQRMPAGQGTDNLSILGRMEFFTLSVCVSASCFSFSNSCAKSTSQTGTGHGHTSCQQILWQSLPTGEWEPEPELSDSVLLQGLIPHRTRGTPRSVSEQSRRLTGSARMWLISLYKSTDVATLGLSLLSLTSFGFCQLCWLMLVQQSRLQRQTGKCHSWQTKKGKK